MVQGGWGKVGPTDNFWVSSRSKVFCNLTEFFTNKFNFSRRGVGVMARWTSLFPFVPKVSLLFHIIHKTVVKNMCRKLSIEQSIKSRFVDKPTLVAVISGVIPLVITTVFIVAQLCWSFMNLYFRNKQIYRHLSRFCFGLNATIVAWNCH